MGAKEAQDLSARAPALLAALAAVSVAVLGSWVPALLCLLPLAAIDAWPAIIRYSARLGSALRKGQRRPVASLDLGDGCSTASASSAASPSAQACRPRAASDFEVCRPSLRDAAALSELYRQDYVECHRRQQGGKAGVASVATWEEALGAVDFEAVIGDVASRKTAGSVRLLKCVEKDRPGSLLGYVLYELREKGSARKKQRYCELVNIVVRHEHQGCGAGRALFDALRSDLVQTAPVQADDLRLYVAKSNSGPLAWYRRLGFVDAGWQSERINGVQVDFLRMARRTA